MLGSLLLVSITGPLIGIYYAPLYCHATLWCMTILSTSTKSWQVELHLLYLVVSLIFLPTLRAYYLLSIHQTYFYVIYVVVGLLVICERFIREWRAMSTEEESNV